MRANPKWESVPVVVVTAKELAAEERARLEKTARRVIRKGEDLSQVVQEVLRTVGPRPAPMQERA
jgi:CheY-like chemotaxis protein